MIKIWKDNIEGTYMEPLLFFAFCGGIIMFLMVKIDQFVKAFL